MRLELQRLVARGPGSLPADVVVDVGALIRAVAETDPGADIWTELADAARRSWRTFTWVVSPTNLPSQHVTTAELAAARAALVAHVGEPPVVASTQPLAGLMHAPGSRRGVVVATANLRNRPYELATLAAPSVSAMLDVAAGEVWTRAVAEKEYGTPVGLLPELEATVGAEFGQKPVVRVAHLERHRDDVARALAAGLSADQANVPPSIRTAIAASLLELRALAHAMRGHGVADLDAHEKLAAILRRPAATATSGTPRTAYVMADVDRSADPMVFREAVVVAPGLAQHVRGHAQSLGLLHTLHQVEPNRWFVPHALDVLGCLADHGAPMPAAAVDPAHVLFVLDPDEPRPLDHVSAAAKPMSPELLAWLGDTRRELDEPAGLLAYVGALANVDAELVGALVKANLAVLLEKDIAPSVPVLARIERRGAWLDGPHSALSWASFVRETDAAIEHEEKVFLRFLGSLDPYASSPAEAVRVFRGMVTLKPDESSACAGHIDDELERLEAVGFEPARALRYARRLDKMTREWLSPFASAPKRLRGRLSPTSTGRWSTSHHNLHGLNKSGLEGHFLRNELRAPPGYELVVADYNAFEGRILAALSDDPLLLKAARLPEFHEEMAKSVFGRSDNSTRASWKSALYGLSYGQGHDGFVRTHPEFTVADASDIYETVRRTLKGVVKYQNGLKRAFKAGKPSVTRGGWRRRTPFWTSWFNTQIQGLGADIFRWCLRALDRELAPLGAFVVHQAHDEVFIATPPTAALQVQDVIRQVMERDVLKTGLLPAGVPLFVKVQSRGSWAEGT